MDKSILDIYTDYLISSFGQTTATGLSALLGGALSHDQISRFLKAEVATSADLWQLVKPLARQLQRQDGILIIDDSVEEKLYSDESELICWHWDHVVGRSVKGLNLLTCLYYSQQVALPVAFELVKKPDFVIDKKTGKIKRAARKTKNELYREMLSVCVTNQLPFQYVLNDLWFASAENMVYIKQTLSKDFVMPLKENRKLSLEPPGTPKRHFVPVSSLTLEADTVMTVWLEDVDFPLLLIKQVFTNKDGSIGIVYLVTSDTTLAAEPIITLYQKRWKVEEYHKSLKSNLGFAKSPTKTVRTQSNHIFACLAAFVKMERLRMCHHFNHFAMKAQLYRAALASAFQQLQLLKMKCSAA